MVNSTARKNGGRKKKTLIAFATALMSYSALTGVALAEDDDKKDIIVTGKYLRALPGEDVSGVFGFDKTITETPRSLSTISADQIERFGIDDIHSLVALSPGTFTNSFFGVGGALDIRGTPGETYFRGVRRLDNPGNYPTPLGASDRIDIVRGPASPIYGPSKTGGYMNFVPKSARSEDGKYLKKPAGELSYTTGSWDKAVLSGEVTGPGKVFGKDFGYTLYAEVEDSGSYYRNIFTKQNILQAAFDTDLTNSIRLEFGGMYHDYKGAQNGGWNRLTQALVDNGTYITGSAQPLDTDGDGQISPAEILAGTGGAGLGPFGAFACGGGVTADGITDACLQANYPYLALQNVGTAKLKKSQVLTGPNDKLNNEDTLLYFDAIWSAPAGWEVKNQMFYEGYKNINLNAYGFSQYHDSWVFEDKVVISKTFNLPSVKIATQLSPSIRHTNFEHGDDYDYEYFHRVDLTVGYTPLSDRLLSLESGTNYSEVYKGNYTDYGIAGLADITFDWGLGVLLGARYDQFDVESTGSGADALAGKYKNDDGGVSWTASVNYTTKWGLIPYATSSKQTTTIAGQGAEIATSNVAGKTFLSESKMNEVGLKGSFFDDRLYFAVDAYKQERTDYSAQSITVNQAVETKGVEAEVRWAATDKLLLTANYTKTEVVNLTGVNDGTMFSFFGAEDLVNVTDKSLIFGGQPLGLIIINGKGDARRAGIPEDLYSGTATYKFDNGVSLSATAIHADSVYSGQSQSVKLPAYTVVDLGGSYETDNWLFRVTVKNAFDEDYFRANFTELFGSTIVLPEQPRSVMATAVYKF